MNSSTKWLVSESVKALELPAVVAQLRSLCGFFGSAQLVGELRPSTDRERVHRLQDETDEAVAVLGEIAGLSCQGIDDIDQILATARVGSVPEAAEFLLVRQTVLALRRFSAALTNAQTAPALSARARKLNPPPELPAVISKTIDDAGIVRDSASPELAHLRRQLRRRRSGLEKSFSKLCDSLGAAGLLREPIYTIRSGRFVVPIRREAQGQVEGVVHDLSASGATAYVEPLSEVAANNDLRTLRGLARSEERRVLGRLAARLGEHADALAAALRLAAQLDLILARGRLAIDQKAIRPRLTSDCSFELVAARHPLLGDSAVPIDIHLGGAADFRALLITGSNAGGKTVALKTVGLLHLMAACGCHIPAASGSTTAVFDAVLADIGDAQSIAQDLSTFSSHMVRLKAALDAAGSNSLVLADEIGAGTDPAEGAALAAAIIDELIERGTAVVATTHFGDLKYHAISHPRAQTASVEFDLASLAPLYRLQIGLAGASHAIEIARRTGLPERICARAREGLTPERREMESLLGQVREERLAAGSELLEAVADRRRARENVEAARRQSADQRSKFEEELARARAQSRRLMREMESLSKRMARSVARSDAGAGRALAQEARALQRTHDEISAPASPTTRAAERLRPPLRPLNPGDRVQLTGQSQPGRVTAVRRGGREYEVAVGNVRRLVRADQVTGVIGGPKNPRPRRRPAKMPVNPAPLRVDMHGVYPHDVEFEVDRHIDNAVAQNRSTIHLVHGLGSGALRDAVRNYLRGHPLVKRFSMGPPSEGGDGLTVVSL